MDWSEYIDYIPDEDDYFYSEVFEIRIYPICSLCDRPYVSTFKGQIACLICLRNFARCGIINTY